LLKLPIINRNGNRGGEIAALSCHAIGARDRLSRTRTLQSPNTRRQGNM